MPISFKADGLYSRQPDAVSYIRGGEVLGTVAFYGHWRGVQMVCRLRGLTDGRACICIGSLASMPVAVAADGTVKAALFTGDISVDAIKGRCVSVLNNSLPVAGGKIKKA